MLPQCDGLFTASEATWQCTRSISFGSACLFTLVIGVYGCRQIVPIFLSTGWYSTNVTMLVLTSLQMALLVYECFVQNSSKILVVAKYCRALQVAISCMLYGKLACDMMNRSRLYYQLLAPVVITTIVLLTLDIAKVVAVDDVVDCHHISWLLSSTASVILSASFAITGRIVLEEIKSASRLQQKFLAVVSTAVTELEQSHRQLWTLVACNLISTSFQLMVDVYVTYGVVGAVTCNSMFFKDGSGALEQFARLVVSIVSYLVPNWATIYVFYLVPRFQFSTALDVPDLGLDDSYELLLLPGEHEHPEGEGPWPQGRER